MQRAQINTGGGMQSPARVKEIVKIKVATKSKTTEKQCFK